MEMHLQHMHLDQAYMRHKLATGDSAWKQINLLLVKTLVFVRLCQMSVFPASLSLNVCNPSGSICQIFFCININREQPNISVFAPFPYLFTNTVQVKIVGGSHVFKD